MCLINSYMYSELGELKEVSHLVASCEVLVTEQCVKMVGTPEETQQAEVQIDHILVGSTSQILSIVLVKLVYFTLPTLLIGTCCAADRIPPKVCFITDCRRACSQMYGNE